MGISHSGDHDSEQLGKEYFGQVVSHYESESKSFRTLLSGVLVFGLLFFFLILLPFVRLHHQHRVIGAQVRDLGAESDRVAVTLVAFRRAAEGFSRLRDAVARGPFELRDSLPVLLSPARQPEREMNAPIQQQMAQRPRQQVNADRCTVVEDRSDWANCRVAAHVRAQFQRYRNLLDASVLTPLQTVPPVAAGLDVSALPLGLDSLQAAFEARLAQSPRFWEQFSGKSDFFDGLRAGLDEFWQRYGFESRRMAVEAERVRLDSLTAGLAQRQKALETGERVLAARLAELDSPLGKLPIGLREAVQIFPLLMAVGFGWCVFVLRRLVTLRQAMREGYEHHASDLADLTERHLTLVAPLWVDRGHPALGQTLLLAPIGIFIAACVLVAYHWTLDREFIEVLALDPWVYGGLYAAAGVGLYKVARRASTLVRALRERAL